MAKCQWFGSSMTTEPTRLGISKVAQGNRVVLVKGVAEELGIGDGDAVAYFRDVDDKIWLRKLQ